MILEVSDTNDTGNSNGNLYNCYVFICRLNSLRSACHTKQGKNWDKMNLLGSGKSSILKFQLMLKLVTKWRSMVHYCKWVILQRNDLIQVIYSVQL